MVSSSKIDPFQVCGVSVSESSHFEDRIILIYFKRKLLVRRRFKNCDDYKSQAMLGHEVVGILSESVDKWERRVVLTQSHCARLLRTGVSRIIVHPSTKRIHHDVQYEDVGCEISDDLSECRLILGVTQLKPLSSSAAIVRRKTITLALPPQKPDSYVLGVLNGQIGQLRFGSHSFSNGGLAYSDDFMSYAKPDRHILKALKSDSFG